MDIQEIRYNLEQLQYKEWDKERQDIINNINFIENLEYEIKEQYNKLIQEEQSQPDEGAMIFENDTEI